MHAFDFGPTDDRINERLLRRLEAGVLDAAAGGLGDLFVAAANPTGRATDPTQLGLWHEPHAALELGDDEDLSALEQLLETISDVPGGLSLIMDGYGDLYGEIDNAALAVDLRTLLLVLARLVAESPGRAA